MVSYGNSSFLSAHLIACAFTAAALWTFWMCAKRTPRGRLQKSFIWAELSMTHLNDPNTTGGVAYPGSDHNYPDYASAEREKVPITGEKTTFRFYSKLSDDVESEMASGRSSAIPSCSQSTNASQHNISALNSLSKTNPFR